MSTDYSSAVFGINFYKTRVIVGKTDIKFVLIYCHRFILTVQDFVEETSKLVNKVNFLVMNLSNQIPAAELRNYTLLKAQIDSNSQ